MLTKRERRNSSFFASIYLKNSKNFLRRAKFSAVAFSCSGLASLRSPIPFGSSFARNKNAIAFFLFGIGFALLAHPFWEFLCKKQERCRVFLVWDWLRFARPSLALPRASLQKEKQTNLQINLSFCLLFFLRRGRDSNPRYLSVRRFSRPVQSTTLPPLQ